VKVTKIVLGVIATALAAGGCATQYQGTPDHATQAAVAVPGVKLLTGAQCQALFAQGMRPGHRAYDWSTQGKDDAIIGALEAGGPFQATFGSVVDDVPGKQVLLYAPDAGRATAYIRAAWARGVNVSVLRICHSRYTFRETGAAMKMIMSQPAVYYDAANPDGSGVTATVKPGTQHHRPAYVDGVQVTWVPGSPAVPANGTAAGSTGRSESPPR
jgi:hypothetical protein